MNKKDYEKKAKTLFGKKSQYKYEKIPEIFNLTDVVNITCIKHGDFKAKAGIHITGKGCPECARNMDVIYTSPQAFQDIKRLFVEEVKPVQKVEENLNQVLKQMPAFRKQTNHFSHFFYNYSDRKDLFNEYYKTNPNTIETLIKAKKEDNQKLSIVFNENIVKIMKLK